MKKIKRIVPHDCNKHWQSITPIFLGTEDNPFAIRKEEMVRPKWGALVQCTGCKQIAVMAIKPEEKKEEEKVGENSIVSICNSLHLKS